MATSEVGHLNRSCELYRVCVISRVLEVCVELNLSAGVEYHEALVQFGVMESDRAKYCQLFLFKFSYFD